MHATEAAVFLGRDAVEAGLADEVAGPKEAFARFIAQINQPAGSLSGMTTAMTASKANEGVQTMKKRAAANETIETDVDDGPDGTDTDKTGEAEETATDTSVSDTSETDTGAATTSAPGAGVLAGRKEMAWLLGRDGIRGNAKRMAAALDLAVKSPGMSVDDIAAMDGRQDKIGEVVIRMDESLKAIRATLSKIEKKLER